MNNEDLIIYVVLDEDSETDIVTTDMDKALEEFGWYRSERKNAFFEIWKNNNCIFYFSWKRYLLSELRLSKTIREIVIEKIEG